MSATPTGQRQIPPAVVAIESGLTISSGVVSILLLAVDPSPEARRWLFALALVLFVATVILHLTSRKRYDVSSASSSVRSKGKVRPRRLRIVLLAVSILATTLSVLVLARSAQDSEKPGSRKLQPFDLITPSPNLTIGLIGGQAVGPAPTLSIDGLGCPNASALLSFENKENASRIDFRVGMSDDSPDNSYVLIQITLDGDMVKEERISRGTSVFVDGKIQGHKTLAVQAKALSHVVGECGDSTASILLFDASSR